MQRLLTSLTLAVGLAFAASAHADTFTFNLTGTGGNAGSGLFSGTGTLTATPDTALGAPANSYLLSDVAGTNVTNFIGPNSFSFTGANGLTSDDDLIYPGGPDFLDASGFAFTDQNVTGVYTVDIYESGGSYSAFVKDVDGDTLTVPVNFSIASTAVTPEPSSILLLATGLLGIAFILPRRRPLRA